MSSQSKDNTCPTCGKKKYDPSCGHFRASGQQEDTLTSQPPSPQSSPLDNVSGKQFDGMRTTPPYAPIIGPDGEELTFDEVTDSLRHFQFKVERILEEATSRRQVDQAAEMLAWTARQLNRCAQDFVRLPEALPSNNASESVRVDAPLTDSKPEKPVTPCKICTCHDPVMSGIGCIHCAPSKPDQLRELLEDTADYLYGYHGDPVDPELRKSIDMLRQLINEEFVANGKMVSSQIIHDILNIEVLISQKQIEILERVITTHDKHYVSCGCGNTATSLLKELRGE